MAAPFDPSTINVKAIAYSYAASKKNRLIIQRNYNCTQDETCPICIEGMSGKSVIYTPCKHRFHTTCLYTMISISIYGNYKCPLCRHDLLKSLINAYGAFNMINRAVQNVAVQNGAVQNVAEVDEEEVDEEEVDEEETSDEEWMDEVD